MSINHVEISINKIVLSFSVLTKLKFTFILIAILMIVEGKEVEWETVNYWHIKVDTEQFNQLQSGNASINAIKTDQDLYQLSCDM